MGSKLEYPKGNPSLGLPDLRNYLYSVIQNFNCPNVCTVACYIISKNINALWSFRLKGQLMTATLIM